MCAMYETLKQKGEKKGRQCPGKATFYRITHPVLSVEACAFTFKFLNIKITRRTVRKVLLKVLDLNHNTS